MDSGRRTVLPGHRRHQTWWMTLTRPVLARAVAWTPALISVAAVAFSGWLVMLPRGPTRADFDGFDVVGVGAGAMAWALTGAVLATVRPRNLLGWLFLSTGVCQAGYVALTAYARCAPAVIGPRWWGQPNNLLVAEAGAQLLSAAWLIPSTIIMAFYPQGRLPGPRWRWPVAIAGVAIVLVGCSRAIEIADVGVEVPLALLDAPFLLYLAALLVIWMGTVVRLARSRSPQRQQLVWLVCVLMPLWTILGFVPVFGLLMGLLVPLMAAVAVVRYRLLGIQVVLRRGLVYGTLTALVVLVYLSVTALAGHALDDRPVPGVLAAAVVAVGMAPARDWLQKVAERLVYGERSDPLRAMTRLGRQFTSTQELDLVPAALASVMASIRAPGAAVVAADGHVIASAGSGSASGQVLPLTFGGKPIGELRVAALRSGEGYTGDQRRLLKALAPQLAVVLRALQLAEALQAERHRVVTATTVERDRLRRDMHDGLGPSLSGVGLGLQALTDMLDDPDPAAAAVLQRIRTEVDTAVLEVRRIIDDLRPAALDTMGLSDAIRRHAAAVSTLLPIDVHADDLPPLAPQIENAAYLRPSPTPPGTPPPDVCW